MQLAIVPVVNGVKAGEPFNEFCRPLTKVWNAHAQKVHGIHPKQAERFQHPEQMAQKLDEYLKTYDAVFTATGHNATGDKNYIERLVTDHKLIMQWHRRVRPHWRDTLTRAKKRKDQLPTENLKLGTLAKYFKLDINAHDALSDALATWGIDEALNSLKTFDPTVIDFSQMSEIDKREKYLDTKYLQINGNGTVYLSEHATKNPDALKVIMQELWDLYVEES